MAKGSTRKLWKRLNSSLPSTRTRTQHPGRWVTSRRFRAQAPRGGEQPQTDVNRHQTLGSFEQSRASRPNLTKVTTLIRSVALQLAPRPDPSPHALVQLGNGWLVGWDGPELRHYCSPPTGERHQITSMPSFLPGPGEVREPGRARLTAPPLARLTTGGQG